MLGPQTTIQISLKLDKYMCNMIQSTKNTFILIVTVQLLRCQFLRLKTWSFILNSHFFKLVINNRKSVTILPKPLTGNDKRYKNQSILISLNHMTNRNSCVKMGFCHHVSKIRKNSSKSSHSKTFIKVRTDLTFREW